ncbi:DUF2975 domain-containing protein [Nocardioides albus]|uniref:DUF2975 domain-containing protein n=1 Tax=Nocardioides albus TaxID=1841 RepID=A0A7W5F709_9ACTN|nr:DUF2975 domain-containing protein [Nocardioides albus]MBB3087506.1 hypothetical protein [Nocardioides albus]GGU09484.1 hypothetical protein GCM10007979_04290 [Nocardioides albus]
MRRNRTFAIAAWVAFTAAVGTTLAALILTAVAISGLSGRTALSNQINLVPGTDLVQVTYQPSWEVGAYIDVCPRIDINVDPATLDCEYINFRHREERMEGNVVIPDDVRAAGVLLEGRMYFEADPGWNPLIASLYGMTVLSLLIVAFLLMQLWLLLRAASQGDPFTDRVVRRLRIIGTTLVAWEVAEPFLWLFLSPKAWDYGLTTRSDVHGLELGSMEPGLQLTPILFGILLLLLAEVFKRGVRLEHEQRLTV